MASLCLQLHVEGRKQEMHSVQGMLVLETGGIIFRDIVLTGEGCVLKIIAFEFYDSFQIP